jgi:hypothetical protein
MVERRADPGDRRAWRVHVTTKGQRAYREAERRHAAKVTKLFARLSRTEMETFIRLVDKLRAALRPAEPSAIVKARKVLVKPRRARPAPAKPRPTRKVP